MDKNKKISLGDNLKQLKLSYVAGGNVKWYNFGNHLVIPYKLAILLSRYLLRINGLYMTPNAVDINNPSSLFTVESNWKQVVFLA